MFDQGVSPVQVARGLRVSTKSACQWRWRAGGGGALASKRPGRCGVQAERGAAGPVAGRAGVWPGRAWLGRGSAVDPGPGRGADRAAVSCPVHPARGVVSAAPDRVLPAGAGAPGRRAGRGGDRRLAGADLGEGTRLAAATGAWICFEDEAGQTLRPPRARTWARRGHTPVVTVSGRGSGRVSVAGLTCYRAGARSRLFYRLRVHRGRKGERRSLSEADYAALVTAAHQ